MKKVHAIIGAAVVLIVVGGVTWFVYPRDQQAGEAPPPLYAASESEIERGRELVMLADCRACHTDRGGEPFAGGHAIPSPFGTFYSPNITPDDENGLGRWTADDFWHALHNGYAPGGSPLYPTFPYTNYTKISRRDSNAMFAYLRTVAAVRQSNRRHDLFFPYSQRWLLIAWRALFFRPGVYEPDPARSAQWNRGAYLTQGLAHCSACHEARNALGGIQAKDNPSGGLVLNWYAPALTNPAEAGLQQWDDASIVKLLKSGQASDASPARRTAALGPMAEVVYESLQHVNESELQAMAVYLKSLPATGAPSRATPFHYLSSTRLEDMQRDGRQIYADSCARCHGDNGEGRPPAAPALAGNRTVQMSSINDPIRVVLYGGFAPGTHDNPRPFGMPPFYPTLRSEQIASVLTYVRGAWGNSGQPITADDVEKHATGPLW